MHAINIPNAYHFESENIESMKDTIESVINSEKINTAKEYVVDKYNLSKWSESIIDVYIKCLN